jgi:NTP pyrophosphatase (non-canonical NTP hydrolase)
MERDDTQLVQNLSSHQLTKLQCNSHKCHWRKVGLDELFYGLRLEMEELEEAVAIGKVDEVWKEAADVANFAAMIADWIQYHRERGKQ